MTPADTFFLLGPTAVGKSDLAIQLALRFNAEIIGADAFQIYQGLNLLTAKPSPDQLSRVPHHLIGEIPITEKFDAAQFRTLALARIQDIHSRGKLALVVGGTGLYIRALTHGLSHLPESDPALRRELHAMSLDQLQEKYAALDPRGITRIDRQNPRRLIRAIEVSILAGAPFSSLREDWSAPAATASTAQPQFPAIILHRTREDLHSRIDQRVQSMFDHGVIEEVRSAPAPGPTASQAIGYSQIQALLRGEITQDQCIAAISRRTRQYAKRQLTWLRRENIFFTFNLTSSSQSDSLFGPAMDFIAARLASAGVPPILY